MTTTTSAILWLLWSVGVCVFAVFVASQLGAFDVMEIQEYHINTTVNNTNESTSGYVPPTTRETILVFPDGHTITINESQHHMMVCMFRFGWC